MPVMQCAGTAGCGRMISVTAVPGGNPAARADPEGFASEWTYCASCRGYTCDRCLGRQHGVCRCGAAARLLTEPERIEIANALAQGRAPAVGAAPPAHASGAAAFAAAMGAAHQPSGDGAQAAASGAAAFNAAMGSGSAAAAPPVATTGSPFAAPASAAAERVGPKLRVRVRGNGFTWPAACVCCAERTERTRRVSSSVTEGRMRKTTSWDVPCCQGCEPHFAKFEPKWLGSAPKERDPEKIVRSPLSKIGMGLWVVAAAGVTGFVGSTMLRHELGRTESTVAGVAIFVVGLPILFGWIYFLTGRRIARARAEVRRYNDGEKENEAGRTRHLTTAKPGCTHTAEGAFHYSRSQDGAEHIFFFARRDLALAFKQANAGAVVSADV